MMMGYDLISSNGIGAHQAVTVRKHDCGHIFTAKFNNMVTGRTKCGICGPQQRIRTCMAGYIKKHARNYDVSKWNDYNRLCTQLSNRTYRQHKQLINPQGLPRGKQYHLDHKVPMIVCFKHGIPPTVASTYENLHVIPARSNLSKNKHTVDQAVLASLLERVR